MLKEKSVELTSAASSYTIDNFECKVGTGKLLVCAVNPESIQHTLEGSPFLLGVLDHFQPQSFDPQVKAADLLQLHPEPETP